MKGFYEYILIKGENYKSRCKGPVSIEDLLKHRSRTVPCTYGPCQLTMAKFKLHNYLACDKNLSCVKKLLQAGAGVNVRDDGGVTPLYLAGSGGVVQMLMNHGGDLSVRDKSGWTTVRDKSG